MTESNIAPLLAALLCTTIISLAPNLLLYLFPDLVVTTSSSNAHPDAVTRTKYWLSLGQCLAAGGLLGDVFLHTLPHSVMDIYANAKGKEDVGDEHHHHHHHEEHHHEEHHHGHGHDHHHDHEFESQMMVLGMAILLGFSVFFIFDCIVRIFGAHHHHHHESKKEEETTNKSNLSPSLIFSSPAILLNLTADALHNFTDGIAIGASFATAASTVEFSPETSLLEQISTLLHSRGGLASLAIFLHEVPHELGDFSILLDSGMSQSKAIQVQFVTALAAYAGTVFGYELLDVMSQGDNLDVLVPFTAGGFIYLACGTILPGVLAQDDGEETEGDRSSRAKGGERKSQLKKRMGQVIAFAVGIGFMYLVATLEHAGGSCCHGQLDLSMDHDHSTHHHHHSHDPIHHHHEHVHNEVDSHHHEDHDHCCEDHDHHHDHGEL